MGAAPAPFYKQPTGLPWGGGGRSATPACLAAWEPCRPGLGGPHKPRGGSARALLEAL
jgi:hypothetical protein